MIFPSMKWVNLNFPKGDMKNIFSAIKTNVMIFMGVFFSYRCFLNLNIFYCERD